MKPDISAVEMFVRFLHETTDRDMLSAGNVTSNRVAENRHDEQHN